MNSDYHYLPATESQDEDLATHHGQTDPRTSSGYGLGFSIGHGTFPLQPSVCTDPPSLSDLTPSHSALSKDQDDDVRGTFDYLFNLFEKNLAAHDQQVSPRAGIDQAAPPGAPVIVEIVSYLRASVQFVDSTISHSLDDVPDVLKGDDFRSILSTLLEISPRSTLQVSPFSPLRQYPARTTRLLTCFPETTQKRLAPLVGFVSGESFNLVSLMTALTWSRHWLTKSARLP
jgi:hypothetical protein